MFPIAYSEFAQIFRNRAVLISNLIMPLAASAFFIYQRDSFAQIGSLGYIAAVLVFTVGAFTLYTTAVTTLSARRQDLFLKRLRSTAAGDPAILSGLTLPVALTAVVQVVVLLGIFAGWVWAAAGGILGLLALRKWIGDVADDLRRLPRRQDVTTAPLPATPMRSARG